MSMLKSEIMRGEFAGRIKSEYRKLISAKVSNVDAERLIVEHFSKSVVPGSAQEGHMWLALALCEWELGRLSPYVMEKAKNCAKSAETGFAPETIQSLLLTLDSPMPKEKKVRLPSYVSHCPWPVGSLLAYRIISSERPFVTQSPFYGKYVLLRIIMIKRHPVSRLAPDAYWSESMIVGLYDWIGDTIPDPEIVKDLSFTPISISEPMLSPSSLQTAMQSLHIDTESNRSSEIMQQLIHSTAIQRIETCCDLSWRCATGIRRDDVFTYLACDPAFENNVSPFFKTKITDYSICHSIPCDAELVNRFKQLTGDVN